MDFDFYNIIEVFTAIFSEKNQKAFFQKALMQPYFLPVLKILKTEKKPSPEKNSTQIFAKKLKVPESSQYFRQKTQDLFNSRILIGF